MNRLTQACIMIFFAAAVLQASVTDLYLRYVKEELRPFLIAASLLLIAAAVMTLWYELRPDPGTTADRTNPDDREATNAEQATSGSPAAVTHDGHAHHEPRVAWLLILPALGLLLVAPPALGSYAAGQAGTAVTTQQDYGDDYPPLPAGDPARTTVLDYAARALFDKGQSIGNRRVELTGFVTPGPDGQPILARMVMSCCAADGRPVKLGMSGNAPTGLANDTWIQVTGRYTDRLTRDPVNDEEIPYIEVDFWRQVTAPKDPYD
ncbi:TIGR03943 family protein [Micromonospora sp. RHAY321]|uniref:TIGR03943 family putative permease subunit n=1 Tax=Micromonospora sp. RHAY321 TaxID=2944807 RepID=UPI00207D07EE|nr:TIGR03943 family protein [Micromonospora sp. RHAY321]MCO1594066.1 TIGR03943 family protein [Micromonospora sp. RHAY321]